LFIGGEIVNIFEFVKNDEKIIDIYRKISEFEDEDKGWAHHDFDHVNNVALLTEKLLSDLNYDKKFIEEAKIAAILHDTGSIKGKDGHAFRSYEFAKQYFEDNNINLENEELVLEAIKIHSDGFDTDNIIALALIISDKLDIKHTRVAKEGYNVDGMRQMQYIEDIVVNIDDGVLKINFLCSKLIDKKELEEFYFVKKVFKSIISFANKMNLKKEVTFNDEKWEMFGMVDKECNSVKRK